MAAGPPEKVLLEARPHFAAFFFFWRSSLPLEPCLTSTTWNNSVRVPFLAAGSGLSLWRSLEREAGRAGLGPSPFPASSCCCSPACDPSSSPPSPLGAEGIGWKLLSEVIPTPGSAEVFQERPGLAGFSPPLPFRNAQRNLPCLVRALPAAPPATPGPRSLLRFKCSLNHTTNQVSSVRPRPGPASSFPWGGRRREGLYPKNPRCPECSESPTLVLARAGLCSLPTARRNCHHCPSPVQIQCPPHARLLLSSLPPSPKKITQGGEGGLGLNTREDPNKGWLWGFGSVLKMTLLKKTTKKKSLFLF